MKRRPWGDPTWVAPRRPRRRIGSVKLMPDYGCELPLWGVDWWELGLSRSLLDDLADWQQSFADGFDPMAGWRTGPDAEAWSADAKRLAARLRGELNESILLEVDLWPLDGAS